jgi:Fe-S-cluster-containing hydrogenase component 2
METLSPYKEAIEVILEAGDGPLKLCYQCGMCTAVCPWDLVRSFILRHGGLPKTCLFQRYFVILPSLMFQSILWRKKVAVKLSTVATFFLANL